MQACETSISPQSVRFGNSFNHHISRFRGVSGLHFMEFLWQWLIELATEHAGRLLATALILSGCGFLQATIGFAAAMVGMPLLLSIGWTLPEAQVIVISAMLPQNILGVRRLRTSLVWRETWLPATARIAALPLGLTALVWLDQFPAYRIRQVVGAVLLLAIGLQMLSSTRRSPHLHGNWTYVAFGSSGFLQGLCGMSGPPMVLWTHAQNWTNDKSRAFLFAMYLFSFAPQFLLLAWQFGWKIAAMFFVGISLLPIVLLGATFGLRFGSRMNPIWLRRVTYTLLILLAVRSILEPLWN